MNIKEETANCSGERPSDATSNSVSERQQLQLPDFAQISELFRTSVNKTVHTNAAC